MISSIIGEQEENLWISVIQHAWVTALNCKNPLGKKAYLAKETYHREKNKATIFFSEKNGMLDWICDHIENLDSDYIRRLFYRSLKDQKLRKLILSSYRKSFNLKSNSRTTEGQDFSLVL